ncbi:sulfite oxidase [Bacillus sp. FJAT-27251]|uniref:sulfite oxidase n=1 Tax=Bacillus sp. FJAT-27251 TaxID=1684142 RepID=UPI0006A7DBC7|nr:sulfite oxidase [Bacillus sp. FJAT-27251]
MEKANPNLTTRKLHPENLESPIHFLRGFSTPANYFYRRNHFSYPELSQSSLWIQIGGLVSSPAFLHFNDLLAMPAKSLLVPLECAGNKRAHFSPKVPGEQWEEGAISQGKWTGVPLRYILERAGVLQNGKEVVFEGADFGKKEDIDEVISFKRSLPLEKAMHPDTLIAYQYNDQPLSLKHGYPYRLIVPGWYAMASIKWLRKIKVISNTFEGPFQTNDYVYYPRKRDDIGKRPVTILNVNSTIQQPLDYSILDTGTYKIEGIAWTGEENITSIQLSFDNGETWVKANADQSGNHPYSWVNWSYDWKADKKGEYTIQSKATDSAGRTQPLKAYWNRKGYGYNAVSKIHVKIE